VTRDATLPSRRRCRHADHASGDIARAPGGEEARHLGATKGRLWVKGGLPEGISATAAVPQIAADLLHRASGQPWAISCCDDFIDLMAGVRRLADIRARQLSG
jgi:hypothetical protein